MTQPAYIYARFSSAEQAKGHSLERQLEDGRAYVARMGWQYDPAREIKDEGRSAYHGINREVGSALYVFEQQADEGLFNNGVVLAVENVDRLTRQGWEQATDLIRKLTSKGVTVAIWPSQDDDEDEEGEVFKAFERIESSRVMRLINMSEMAERESRKKSNRLKKAWSAKIERAQNGDSNIKTGLFPGWLERHPETGILIPNPHRVSVLNEIFDWYCDGKSLPWIERELNGRGEPSWGRGLKGNKAWNVATLHKILTKRAVLGEYAPRIRTGAGRVKVSRGFVLPDFYPQVISPDKFNRVQTLRTQRKRWGGRNATASFRNLFTNLATCSECRGRMHMTGYTKAGTPRSQKRENGEGRRLYVETKDKAYLVCNNASRAYGCTNKKMHRYFDLERGILSQLFDLAMGDTVLKPSDHTVALRSAIAERERLVGVKRHEILMLVENLSRAVSDALAQRVALLEGELREDEVTLQGLRRDLELELGKAPPEQDLKALVEVRCALTSDDAEVRYAARVKTHQALQGLIRLMDCEPTGEVKIVIGDNAVGMTFDDRGNCTDRTLLNAPVLGPDGERDWHPDAEGAST